MQLKDFHYILPKELIAHYPAKQRTDSRLLCLSQNKITHQKFSDLVDLLKPNDLFIFNNTKVIPARLWGEKPTGGKAEILIERILNAHEALAHVHVNRSPKNIWLENGIEIEVIGRQENLFKLKFLTDQSILEILDQIGRMPLPPYINREDDPSDRERYQTIYAKHNGSVAAPTAGLHFDETLMQKIKEKVFVTLHVGAGTFQPVRAENILKHKMHAEFLEVSQEVCDKVLSTKKQGGRVIAVGTTSVRALETAALSGSLKPFSGETDIFIYPGFQFKIVDAMVTNFHLPESTLLILVSAFAGRENILRTYQEAIKKKYRFFSYGDAMFIERQT